ncbi:hypothetical protein [Pseudomonas sp. S1_F04]
MNRRRFMSLFPAFALLGSGLSSFSRPAFADPATAIMAAQTVLSILASFSRADGGLGAMLNAQLQIGNLIISQLVSIQKSLAQLNQEVSDLDNKIPSWLMDQYVKETSTELLAAVDLYRSKLEASNLDPEIWENEVINAQVQQHLQEVSQRRAVLSELSKGWGTQGAIVAPVGCAFEVAAQYRLGVPPAVIRTTMRDYLNWTDRMLGKDAGSIAAELESTIKEHDTIIDHIAITRLGKELEFTKYKISNKQGESSGTDTCILITNASSEGGNGIDFEFNKQRFYGLTSLARAGSYVRYGFIKEQDDSVFGIKFLKYRLGDMRVTAIGGPSIGVDGFPPQDGTQCRRFGSESSMPLDPNLFVDFADQQKFNEKFNEDRALLEGAILQLHAVRAHIGICVSANAVASQLRQRLIQQLAETCLGGIIC